MCSCQVPSFDRKIPKCLWCLTSFMYSLFIINGGCLFLLVFRDTKRDSDFDGLRFINHVSAILWTVSKSEFNNIAALLGLSKLI